MTSFAHPKATQPAEHYQIIWRGIDLQIIYHPHSFCGYAHLEIQSTKPRVPLPITETGYRSHFLPREAVEQSGGPVDCITRWLDTAAQSRVWKAREMDLRQGQLL